MARKSRSGRVSSRNRRTHKRTHRRTHKRTNKRSTYHRRGGMAPVGYHLSGSWPSRMSLGQGADYFKYHEGQHGGAALGMGPFPGAVLDPGLPAALRGPAHIGGIDKAIADVRGLKDQAGGKRRRGGAEFNNNNSTKTENNNENTNDKSEQEGGRRRRHCKSHKKSHSKRHSKRHSRKHRSTRRKSHHRRRGGSLGYAPFPSAGMLLSSPKEYAQAGLNPEWKTDVAFTDAKIRDTQ